MIEFLEGWDHYNNATQFFRKWDAASGTPNNFVAGRFTGNAVQFVSAGIGAQVTLTSVQTRVVGFAWQINSIATASIICQFLDAGSAQVDLRTTTSGQLQVTRNGTVLGTSTATVAINTWYYIEFKCKIDPSTGTYDVHLAGATILSGTGNTRNSANSTVNQVRLSSSFGASLFDDCYILNTSGSMNNDLLGECRIITSLPNADGSTDQWTPSTGTSHYAMLDETSPNDDTDYVSSSTVGQIDLVKFPAISPTGPILGVQTVMTARKDDVGLRQIVEQCKSGATTATGATAMTLGSSYGMGMQVRETDPATGLAWSLTALNAAEFGSKVSA